MYFYQHIDFCRNSSLLCQNNATCVNRPDLRDFSCNCSDPYYGRYCENCNIHKYCIFPS